MYKKIIFSLFLIFLLTACSTLPNSNKNNNDNDYVKSVWITYYELSEFTDNASENEFKKRVGQAFKTLSKNGFNRVTVQVRPFADAFYKSSYFQTSSYLVGNRGDELRYDALKIMTELAHKYHLEIEAWINPYRISNSTDFSEIPSDDIVMKYKDTENIIVCDTGIYFNPASPDANSLIINGVKEIVMNYDVNSICFDDYFYPTKNKSIDKDLYKKYKDDGGKLSLDDWRRENVSNMISSVYRSIKEINENVTFGISPASNIENNYNSLYADVEKWATNDGYVDYLCPQIYFGFQNENQPFMSTTKKWIQMAECDLYVALPLYKSSLEDEFAGESGRQEFVKNNNIVARQVTYLSKLDEVKGFYVFSYSSLKDNEETKNLYSAMQ